jgi:zinc transport system permease protein
MFEILSYWFFQKALIAGLLVSLISGGLWSLVVLRREPNITHAIANILFLWIVVSLFFSGNYYVFWILFAIIWVLLLTLLEKYTRTSPESSKEILAQIWLAGWIFLIWLLGNMQIDVFNFLFWNILFVDTWDIYMLIGMLCIWGVLSIFFGKKMLRITLSPEIAKSQWINSSLYELWYLVYLAIFIALSLKIFWVLLLWAFLVLPWNIWKMSSKSLKWVFICATLYSLISVVIWLFSSYFLDTSAGATIVLILW